MGGSININDLEEWEDTFGDPVVKNTLNALDLPSFYTFSEERYRYIENGTRIGDPDAESTRFTDATDHFLIEPDAGDTIEFRTAESPRYVVGSDAAVSWSFQFISGLQDASDVLRVFLGDAFEIEYTGAGDVTFRALDNGTVQREKSVDLPVGLDVPTRPEITFNWYGVGRAALEIDYTEDPQQKTTDPVVITADDDWVSGDPTGPVGFELDVTNPGITFESGSIRFLERTGTEPTGRPKPHLFSADDLNDVAASGYTVAGALRIDPDRDNVFVTVSETDVTANANVDCELTLLAVDPADTDADFLDVDGDGTDEGPAYPRNNSPQNSVLQFTPNVSTFPTRTYPVDGSTIPDGRCIGAGVENASGKGANSSVRNKSFARARPIYPDDVVLMVGHTPDVSTATAVNVFMSTDQDW